MSKVGKVIESTGSWYKVAVDDNPDDTVQCRLPGRFRLENFERTNPLAVGDNVSITINEDGTGSIEDIHERSNYITREATHGRRGEQILASNIDRAFLILSIRKPRLKQGLIDRFLVTCEAYEIPPYLVINKMDLADDADHDQVEHLVSIYEDIGYPITTTSIHDEASLNDIVEALKNNTSVFIGPSGVGKSSILNVIDPSLELKVAPISEHTGKGQHTTTFARLHPLQTGGFIIDTPGIREFGLVDIDPQQLDFYFPEMIEHLEECQFNDCTHNHEPKCGVKEALEQDLIYKSRYDSYLSILKSLQEGEG